MRKSVRYILIAVCFISTAVILIMTLRPANHAKPVEEEPSEKQAATAEPVSKETPVPTLKPETKNESLFKEMQSSIITGEGIKMGFYVIGHAYGTPENLADGIHEPVQAYLDGVMRNELLDFGVFTGDIVCEGKEQEFADFKTALDATGKRWYVAPGNHDANSVELFEEYIGQNYGYFVEQDNLFIYLDCVERWDIPDAQLDMMHTALAQNKDVDNIFVFTHQLNWWDPDAKEFEGFSPNSTYEYDAENKPNFYSDVLPLFNMLGENIYFIAGDTGAFPNGYEIYYRQDGRFTYIASGVGGSVKDSAIEFYIMESGDVYINLVALNGAAPNALGSITDYTWYTVQ